MLSLLEVLARSGTVQLNAPTSFLALPGGAAQVNLTWVRASAGYVTEVYRNGSLYFTTAAGAQSYNDTGATAGSAFTYRIRHKSGTSYSSFTVELVESGTPPAPVITTGEVVTDDVTIGWAAVDSATGYEVFRDGASIGTTTGLTMTDSNRPNGTYVYTVKATNDVNQSAASSPGYTAVVSYAAPLTDPYGFGLAATYADRVEVTWTNGDGTASTEIYRGTSPNPTSLLTTKSPGDFSHTDTSLPTGTLYYYRIRHVKGAQVSNYVEDDVTTTVPSLSSITIGLLTPTDPTSAIQVSWAVTNPFFNTRVDVGSWADTEGYASGAGATSVSSPYTFGGIVYTLGGATTIGFNLSELLLKNGDTGVTVDSVAPATSFKATGVEA